MEEDWIEYKCNSGKTLFLYNKVTGEQKCPQELREGKEYRSIYGYAETYKQYSTTASQTDDNGCNNGCMSMYINTDPCHVSNPSDLAESRSSVETCVEQRDLHLAVVKSEQSNLVQNSVSSDDIEPSKNTHEDASQDTTKIIQEETENDNLNYNNAQDVMKGADESSSEKTLNDKRIVLGKYHECPVCKKVFDARYLLKRHALVHTGKKNFECHYCKKKFTRKDNLNAHFKTKHLKREPVQLSTLQKQHKCPVCKKEFKAKCTLNRHMFVHIGKKNFECTYCKQRFTRNENLSKHLVRKHSDPYSSNNKDALISQQSSADNEENSSSCSELETAREHKVTLVEQEQFPQFLGTETTGQNNFNENSVSVNDDNGSNESTATFQDTSQHLGKKIQEEIDHVAENDDSQSSFQIINDESQNIAQQDNKSAMGRRHHKCPVCNKVFDAKYLLKRHASVHTGKKNFECHYCKKKFTRKDNLNAHINRKHRL